jgi:hypothetical protein
MFFLKASLSPFLPSDMIEGGLCPLGQSNTQKSIGSILHHWTHTRVPWAFAPTPWRDPAGVIFSAHPHAVPDSHRMLFHRSAPWRAVVWAPGRNGRSVARYFTRRGNHIRRLLHRLRGKTGNPVSGTFFAGWGLRVAGCARSCYITIGTRSDCRYRRSEISLGRSVKPLRLFLLYDPEQKATL